ncbi:DNA-binding response regulator, partial [Streptomyces pharetrae]
MQHAYGSTQAQRRSARVLVVDDDPTVAEVVAAYLDRAGHVVDRAGDGPSALA